MPKHFEALLSQYLKRFYYINHPSFNDKKMRECLDKGNKFEAMLTDFSKPFDCLAHFIDKASYKYIRHVIFKTSTHLLNKKVANSQNRQYI